MRDITVDKITADFLKSHNYTEHVAHWEMLGELLNLSSLSLLEYGCGYSTKWFLDNFNDVVSCEIVHNGSGPAWLLECEDLYKEYVNWRPVLTYLAPCGCIKSDQDIFHEQDEFCKELGIPGRTVGRRDYNFSIIRDLYECEYSNSPNGVDYFNHAVQCFNGFSSSVFEGKRFDAAFIDHGSAPLRGPCVQSCINNGIDIIMCHDMGHERFNKDHIVPVNMAYNYHHIKHDPEEYQFFRILKGQGSGLWIKKNPQHEELIGTLKCFNQKQLKEFFSLVQTASGLPKRLV